MITFCTDLFIEEGGVKNELCYLCNCRQFEWENNVLFLFPPLFKLNHLVAVGHSFYI